MSRIPPFRHRVRTTQPMLRASQSRLSGGAWTALRARYLMQHPMCERCGAAADHVHHVQPRCVAPHLKLCWDNLMSVCKACHNAIHSQNKDL